MRGKTGLAEMLKGGVIMDVTTADQARSAEEAGAWAVMALDRVPADIRAPGGAQRRGAPEVHCNQEPEVLTPADAQHHIDKWNFTVPFVCGCTNLGEAL